MEAFFFGPSSSPLLGVYHPAKFDVDRFEGIVLCYPFGQEYMRAHRSFRQLSNSLTKKGYHVLRFDYSGTGDSAGNLEEVTASDWLRDIDVAIQELKDMAGLSKVGIMGLRLGGLLAARVAASRTDLNSLVLWDPVVTGTDYLNELRAYVGAEELAESRSNFVDSDGSLHLNGFAMTAAFQESLAAISLIEEKPAALRRILQVNSHETSQFDALSTSWKELAGYEHKFAAAPHDWNYVDNVGGIMLPQPVLQAITDWV